VDNIKNIYEELNKKSINKRYVDRYIEFINHFQNSGNIQHHILPKAKDMWPEYSELKIYEWNKCFLGEREHFIAHWILWKALGGSQTFAFYQMKNKNKEFLSSRVYKTLKENVKEIYRTDKERNSRISKKCKDLHKSKKIGMWGKKHSEETKKKISKAHANRTFTETHINKIKESQQKTFSKKDYIHPNKGKIFSEEHRKKISDNHADISGFNNPMYGKKFTSEHRKKISEAAKNRPKKICEHCRKSISPTNYSRWHGENCKMKKEELGY